MVILVSVMDPPVPPAAREVAQRGLELRAFDLCSRHLSPQADSTFGELKCYPQPVLQARTASRCLWSPLLNPERDPARGLGQAADIRRELRCRLGNDRSRSYSFGARVW